MVSGYLNFGGYSDSIKYFYLKSSGSQRLCAKVRKRELVMQSFPASAMEDSISFLTPTGEQPLKLHHSSSIRRPVQLWLALIFSPLQTPKSQPFVSFTFTFLSSPASMHETVHQEWHADWRQGYQRSSCGYCHSDPRHTRQPSRTTAVCDQPSPCPSILTSSPS